MAGRDDTYNKTHHVVARLTLLLIASTTALLLLIVGGVILVAFDNGYFGITRSIYISNMEISIERLIDISPFILASFFVIPVIVLFFLTAEVTAGIRVIRHRDYKTPLHKTPDILPTSKQAIAKLANADISDKLPGHGAFYTKDITIKKPRVIAIIPAHNEQETLGSAIDSLLSQTYKPNRIYVLADNCTDDTVKIANQYGCNVFKTKNNINKKAGALNQILSQILPKCNHNDLILVMDADGVVSHDFLKVAVDKMLQRRDLTAIGGLFYGEKGHGILGQLQRNEYARYQRQIGRRKGEVFVLTGTASMFRAPALVALAKSRGHLVPGNLGEYYDTEALTEDNEITIALKSLGGVLLSPQQCRVTTEVMTSWGDLWRQRLRWQRGALENIGAYGITRSTFRYWFQQVGIGYGVIALNSYLILMLITFLSVERFEPILFWLIIGMIFVVERTVTAWRAGRFGVLISLPLFIEIAYDLFIQAAFLKSLVDIIFAKEARWGHATERLG